MSRITQKGATGPLALVANGAFQTSTDSSLATLVGSRWDLSDGREVILASASSATTVAAGKLYQDPAQITDHQNLAVTAYTAYSANGNVPAKVTCTLGATAVVANQYAGGFLIVNDNNGEGQSLRIASHPAADASASLAVTLEEGATVAITTASEVSLLPPHGKNVIICPTAVTGAAVGVSLYAIAASAYGFFVSKGLVACLGDGTIAVGSAVSPSNAVAGAVENGVIAQGFVGNAVQTGVDTEYRGIFVNL
ncbi:MAG: hypothetical protein IPP74_14580 [Alphaproteobacteria bacterium]|nr:hypothetical protein [Alphaproteobacteria bacterium]